jgi:hypothetical protein
MKNIIFIVMINIAMQLKSFLSLSFFLIAASIIFSFCRGGYGTDYYYLENIRNYSEFDSGTTWIYRSEALNICDTCTVYYYFNYWTETQYERYRDSEHTECYICCKNTFINYHDNFSYNSMIRMRILGAKELNEFYLSCCDLNKISYCINRMDSFNVDGKNYKNVYMAKSNYENIYNGKDSVKIYSVYYFAENIGLIRKEVIYPDKTIDWNLQDYTIVKPKRKGSKPNNLF